MILILIAPIETKKPRYNVGRYSLMPSAVIVFPMYKPKDMFGFSRFLALRRYLTYVV